MPRVAALEGRVRTEPESLDRRLNRLRIQGWRTGVIVGVDRRVASPRSRGWASHTVMAVDVHGRVADEAFLSRGRRDFETVSMAPGFLDCRVIGAGAKFAMNSP